MARNADLIIKSIDENLERYFKGRSYEEYVMIVEVLSFQPGFEKHLNAKITRDDIHGFLDEFLGLNEWCNILYDVNNPDKMFRKGDLTTYDILNKIRILMLPIGTQYLRKLGIKLATNKADRATLKVDIAEAVLNSYEDGIFYKVEGWCNVSTVLEEHKLIKL